MSEEVQAVLREILKRFDGEVWPKMANHPGEGGYDCCGCGTYTQIFEDMQDIVLSYQTEETD